jgi:hypothetical protein
MAYTIFQRLNKVLGGNNTPTFEIDPNSFAHLSPTEINVKKLEAQQVMYLQAQHTKIGNSLKMTATLYESTRMASYYDYEAMDYMPEITQALNILAQESTTVNDKGSVITVYSESNRVKDELNKLFNKVLNVNTNLTTWARNLCKYGEVFINLTAIPNKGIINIRTLPSLEITREEAEFGRQNIYASNNSKIDDVKFLWKGQNLEFNSFEIAHFRLLTDDKKLPYGTSVLEGSRRVWKQLTMSEDAMLAYRVSRAPERRVHKIFVGNMDDKDIPSYIEEVAAKFKRSSVVNNSNGNKDTRYNVLSIDEDYFVPVRDMSISNPIETLPGASNLDQISDLQYLQNKLLCALGIPKAFIGFDESTGEGKNLSIMDIRFARSVNRIQQSLILELNKMAIIHLFMLGFEDDLDNFTITLNNPSTQAKMLEVENLKSKADLYIALTTKDEKGISPWSRTKALQEVFGMSEEEIRFDLQRQTIENAAFEESTAISEIIKQTGVYSDLYKAYGIDPDKLFADKEIVGADENGEPVDNRGTTPFVTGGGGSAFDGGADLATDFSKAEDEGPQLDIPDELKNNPETPPTENGVGNNESPDNVDNQEENKNLSETKNKSLKDLLNENVDKPKIKYKKAKSI